MKLKDLLKEAMSSQDKEKIKQIIKTNKFLSLRDPLKKAGFKVDFQFSPVAHYNVKKGSSTVLIVNKKYADDYEFEYNGIAMGDA